MLPQTQAQTIELVVLDDRPTGAASLASFTPSPALPPARSESLQLAAELRRAMLSKPAHIQALATSRILGELIARSITERGFGPVEGLIEDIEFNIDFNDDVQVSQYTRGLGELIEFLKDRLATL